MGELGAMLVYHAVALTAFSPSSGPGDRWPHWEKTKARTNSAGHQAAATPALTFQVRAFPIVATEMLPPPSIALVMHFIVQLDPFGVVALQSARPDYIYNEATA